MSRRLWRRRAYAFLQRLHLLREQPWRTPALIAVVVSTVLAVSCALPQHPKAPLAPAAAGVVIVSTDHPDESPLAGYRSTATGTEPKYLRLPTIGTEGFVQKVGVDQHRQIAVPTNINLAGWFTESVAPGQLGLSIIDGHLNGSGKPGIFARLEKLKPGATFTVELANGATRQFRVATVQSLPTDQAAAALFSQAPGVSSQLNLITCGGSFNKSTHTYDHRVIVTSEYISSQRP
jgi:hypothetical protein